MFFADSVYLEYKFKMKRERERKKTPRTDTRKEKRSYLSVKVYIIRWTSTISSVPNFAIFLFLSLRIVFLPVHDSSWNKALGVSAPPWKEKPWFYFWTEVSPTRLPRKGARKDRRKDDPKPDEWTGHWRHVQPDFLLSSRLERGGREEEIFSR